MKLFFVKSIEPFISKLPAAAEVGAGMRYTLRDAKIGNSLYTTGINTCSGFGLRAGEQNLLGHIKPEDFNPRNFAGAFEKLVKDFQNKYGEVRALVLADVKSRSLTRIAVREATKFLQQCAMF